MSKVYHLFQHKSYHDPLSRLCYCPEAHGQWKTVCGLYADKMSTMRLKAQRSIYLPHRIFFTLSLLDFSARFCSQNVSRPNSTPLVKLRHTNTTTASFLFQFHTQPVNVECFLVEERDLIHVWKKW